MRRIMLTVAYDGTDYVGWQMQPNGIAVEQVINKALSDLLKEEIVIAGASRTDSGVHALGNVAIFDTETRIPADKICFALNQRLPKDIVCTKSLEVKPDFHPRHADCTKIYEYTIYNAVHPDPIKRRYSYFVYVPLDIDAMRKAAGYLLGEHDFASFCSAHAQVKTTVRTIYSLDIFCDETGRNVSACCCGNGADDSSQELSDGSFNQNIDVPDSSSLSIENGRNEHSSDIERMIDGTEKENSRRKYMSHNIAIRISGNGFLYNMVRIIVGTLVKVGYHFYPPEYVKKILEGRDRKLAGPKAPAEGLKLVGIEYRPEDYMIM